MNYKERFGVEHEGKTDFLGLFIYPACGACFVFVIVIMVVKLIAIGL